MDASTTSLLLLFFANLFFLILIVISFGLIRRIRGDKAKVRLNKLMKDSGYNDLDVALLDPKRSKISTKI